MILFLTTAGKYLGFRCSSVPAALHWGWVAGGVGPGIRSPAGSILNASGGPGLGRKVA